MRTSIAIGCTVMLFAAHAAGMQRTFVSSIGNDGNPCSLTLPCRGFAAALVQTDAGGEIVVLDSGGYGSLTIGKSVTIVAPPGLYAGVSVFAGDGVTINAGPTDEVVIRGLTINAQGGNNGIAFTSGGTLHIESCTIRGFSAAGMANVSFTPSGASKLFVKDSYLRGGAAGLTLANTVTPAAVTVDNTRVEDNGIGIKTSFAGRLTVRNSIVVENASHGFDIATAAGQSLTLDLDNVLAAGNGGDGIHIAGGAIVSTISNSTAVRNATGLFVQGAASAAVARVMNSVIAGNTVGTQTGSNGSILTPQSNTIEGNGSDGTVSGNYSAK